MRTSWVNDARKLYFWSVLDMGKLTTGPGLWRRTFLVGPDQTLKTEHCGGKLRKDEA